MRYDKTVHFVKQGQRTRKPNGDYLVSEPVRTKRKADVTDMSITSRELYFRDVKAESIVIRIQNTFAESFDYIEFDNRKWQTVGVTKTRRDTSYKCGVFNG
ncbi:hypothetical protein ACV7JQ_09060 [Globicatella sulfidifaciens]